MRVYTSVMTEDALVNRLKQNSQSAFEELVKQYGRRLYVASSLMGPGKREPAQNSKERRAIINHE